MEEVRLDAEKPQIMKEALTARGQYSRKSAAISENAEAALAAEIAVGEAAKAKPPAPQPRPRPRSMHKSPEPSALETTKEQTDDSAVDSLPSPPPPVTQQGDAGNAEEQ